MKKCVACAEEIQPEAALCRHCKTLQTDSRFLYDPSFLAAGESLEGDMESQVPDKESDVGPGYNGAAASASKKPLVAIGVGVFLLMVFAIAGMSGTSSGGSPAQSEMYKIGYSYGESIGVKLTSTGDSYQLCNSNAETYYYTYGGAFSQEEMDDWLQGCLAYVRG